MADAVIRTEKTSVDDRLVVMIFLAALFHLILILGITFAPPAPQGKGDVPTLEVMLVSDAVPETPRNEDARYLAQRTQQGAGNMLDDSRSQMPTASDSPFDQPGDAEELTASDLESGATATGQQIMASTGVARRLTTESENRAAAEAAQALPQRVAGVATLLPSTEGDPDLRLKGPFRRELLVTASTRQSDVAVYLDAWRRRVERVGTLNFPNEARRSAMSGNPVVEVVLAADGSLAQVSVRRSSGHPELDRAAIDTLRLASPFEPFSQELAAKHDAIRFAYEWQFVAGQLTGSSVSAPADPQP